MSEKLRVDITAILIMVTLIVLGLVSPEDGVSGFSNPATLTVMGMFILSSGIQKTGIVYILGKRLIALAGKSEIKMLLLIALFIGPVSGFINNTAAVAITLPMILGVSDKCKIPSTRLLIPLSFFAMLGGTLTLVGTSTNILANDTMIRLGYEGFSFFEFSKIGIIILVVGIIYFLTIGRFLLPKRQGKSKEEEMITFLSEVEVQKKSKVIDKTLRELKFEEKYDLTVQQVKRGRRILSKYITRYKLQAGDILIVAGNRQRILDLHKKEGLKILPDFNEKERSLPIAKAKVVKLLLTRKSRFHLRTLKQIDFRRRYNAVVLGIQHRKKLYNSRLSQIPLKIGDAILVQVAESNLGALKRSKDFLLLREVVEEFHWHKIVPTLLILAAVIGLSALNIMPLMVAVLLGVVAMFITGIFQEQGVYDSVSWDIVFLLAGIIPLSIAMENTGASKLVADLLVESSTYLTPMAILIVFYAVTTVLTEIISNNAAVILLIPVAINTAEQLGLNPIAFVLVVMFAASTSFLSPVGYQTNTMVYSAGNYKFNDFWKVGAPLNIILMLVTTYLIVEFWGL